MHTGVDGSYETPEARAGLVHPLGDTCYGREDGPVGMLDLLSHAGLPVPKGFIVSREAHRKFLRFSGLMKEIQSSAPGRYSARRRTRELRRRYTQRPLEESLNRAIRGALLDLGARTVVVHSTLGAEGGLGTIPSVLAALRRAWLSNQTLERQITAITGDGEIPTWPVLIQREPYPEYTGWSTTQDIYITGESRGRREEAGVALYDARLTSGAANYNSIARLTLEAEAVLKEPTRLEWGFENGRWCLLSIHREDETSRESAEVRRR